MIGKMNVKESKIKDNILKWKRGGKEWIKMQLEWERRRANVAYNNHTRVAWH